MSLSLQATSQAPEHIILDVRLLKDSESIDTAIAALRTYILSGLRKPQFERTLPTLLLYDERGLRLYDDLTTYAPEYYLFAAEEQILSDHSKDIVALMGARKGDAVVELGAGSLRKTSHILRALADVPRRANSTREASDITYYALDLERRELVRTLSSLDGVMGKELEGKVVTKGMWGTYDGGLAYIRNGGLLQQDEVGDTARNSPTIQEKNEKPLPPLLQGQVVPQAAPQEPARPSSPSQEHDDSDTNSESNIFTERDEGTSHYTRPSTFPLEHDSESRAALPSRSSSPIAFDDEKQSSQSPLHIMFLGSSIGNFTRPEAAEFLKSLPLRPGRGDTLLLGLDHRNEPDVVEVAYNDPAGYTKKFALNGLRVAERVLQGHGDDLERDYGEIFAKDGWELTGKWNELEGRHESFFKSTRKQKIVIPHDIDRPQDPETFVSFEEGELISYELCCKYSTAEALALFAAANLRVVNRWTDQTSRYSVWLLERPPFTFPLLGSFTSSAHLVAPTTPMPVQHSPSSVPTLAEWSQLWSLWDMITLDMIPPAMLLTKPIDLRHKCLFYLGHIPAFLDIHLTKLAQRLGDDKAEFTSPAWFAEIFERGIDPHVDDPDTCNPHSTVPTTDEEWPSLEEIIAYRDRVRARLIQVYEMHGKERLASKDPTIRDFDRAVGRVLWMTWEHEAFHAETLLYMLLQKAGDEGGTLPPRGFIAPIWDILAKQPTWSEHLPPASTITIGPADLELGHNDVESEDKGAATVLNGQDHEFGWDNEGPLRQAQVLNVVKVETRPILNGEYYEFWSGLNKEKRSVPASWVVKGTGDVKVRSLYGPVPLQVAKNWPFIGSFDELNAFSASKGGRLPTEPELILFRDEYEGSLESNIGFKSWHCIPPLVGSKQARGHNGGVWEWTSTVWRTHPGFTSSSLYPGYSSDFFDEKHHVVLGGSYATASRLAQRRSLRNWYQHNYPFAWIGGRVVYDI